MTLPPKSKLALPVSQRRFSDMSDDELVEYCRELYREEGVSALTFQSIKRHRTLYTTLYTRGFKQAVLLDRLGLAEEYRAWKAQQPIRYGANLRERWTWERVVREARKIQNEQGFLPPAAWWQVNGGASFVQAVYLLGQTWEHLRIELGDFRSSQFVQSRAGIRWRSHAEASLSNFLYARGVLHRRGSRYPKEYEDQTGRAYGTYDMHFDGLQGAVDVEVWGDKPHGTDSERYRIKREGKEQFNANNTRFLGIHFADCYSDAQLTKILEPYIGVIAPHRFDRPTDRIIQSTNWSNADELLQFCKAFAASQPNGRFPTEEWLRKRGKWVDRPGEAYNTLSIYIKGDYAVLDWFSKPC